MNMALEATMEVVERMTLEVMLIMKISLTSWKMEQSDLTKVHLAKGLMFQAVRDVLLFS